MLLRKKRSGSCCRRSAEEVRWLKTDVSAADLPHTVTDCVISDTRCNKGHDKEVFCENITCLLCWPIFFFKLLWYSNYSRTTVPGVETMIPFFFFWTIWLKTGTTLPPQKLPLYSHLLWSWSDPLRGVDARSQPALSSRPWIWGAESVAGPGAHREKYAGDWPNVAEPQKKKEKKRNKTQRESLEHIYCLLWQTSAIYVALFNVNWWERADIVHPAILLMLLLLLNAAPLSFPPASSISLIFFWPPAKLVVLKMDLFLCETFWKPVPTVCSQKHFFRALFCQDFIINKAVKCLFC